MASHPVAALPKHALDIREAAQAVADFVPIDFVFRSSRVCTRWRKRWSRDLESLSFVVPKRFVSFISRDPLRATIGFYQWSFPQGLRALSIDFSKSRIGGQGARELAKRLPMGLTSLSLNFTDCRDGETGVRSSIADAIAEGLPAGLQTLSLDFTNCLIGEGGAQALAARIPAAVRSLSLDFTLCSIGVGGVRALKKRVPWQIKPSVKFDWRDDVDLDDDGDDDSDDSSDDDIFG
jgi:hypothetical protein